MEDLHNLTGPMTDDRIRLREEVAEQIKALKDIKIMGEYYGLDLSRPATSAQEAVQWVYMAYLAAVKEQDGAAMSLGNVSSFLDIFIEYDSAHGKINETFARGADRPVRYQTPHGTPSAYAVIQRYLCRRPDTGNGSHWRTFQRRTCEVTKTSFRFLQTLYNLGPSPEPNLTILWGLNSLKVSRNSAHKYP